jgi:hypothetical protein
MPHVRRTSIARALALVAVLAAGCRSEPVGPRPRSFEGTFVLETVNGIAIPAVVSEGAGERHTVLADTLAFANDRTVVYSMTVRVERQGAVPTETVHTNRFTFQYELEGSGVKFGHLGPCGPAALCVGISEGDFTSTGLSVVDHIFWRPGVMVYRQLPLAEPAA